MFETASKRDDSFLKMIFLKQVLSLCLIYHYCYGEIGAGSKTNYLEKYKSEKTNNSYSDGKMGAETDTGYWKLFYGVAFPFSIDNRQFFYAHDLFARNWFIQELLPDGKMGSQTDYGNWNNAYEIGFSFSDNNGRQFFYAQRNGPDGPSWFIQELLPGGKMGAETDHGTWQNYYRFAFHFSIDGRKFFYAQAHSYIIHELLDDGKMGATMEYGSSRNEHEKAFPFYAGGRSFFYVQNLVEKNWFIQELLPDGELGKETDSGSWKNAYQIAIPFSIDDRQFFYAQNNLDGQNWFIQELLPGGKMGKETDYGTWRYRYTVGFAYSVHGKTFLYGQNSDINYWFIQQIE